MPVDLQDHHFSRPPLREGTYLTDGVDLFWVMGWSRTGIIVEDCLTGETRWKHFNKIEQMHVVVPEERG